MYAQYGYELSTFIGSSYRYTRYRRKFARLANRLATCQNVMRNPAVRKVSFFFTAGTNTGGLLR